MLVEAKDILTMILALYGASLSTLNFLVQIRSKSWRIATSYSLGVEDRTQVVRLHAVNFGERNVALQHVWVGLVEHKNRRRMVLRNVFGYHRPVVRGDEMLFGTDLVLNYKPAFPIDLAPGKSVEVVLKERALLECILDTWGKRAENIVGVFEDETGKRYKTRQMHIDIQHQRISSV
jgi:hypothetical protein